MKFEAISFFSGPHAQTLLPFMLPSPPEPKATTRHWITLDDGDSLCLHENLPEAKDGAPLPTLLLLHGLAGSHSSDYMRRLATKATQNGWRVLRLDLRACGAGEDKATRSFHGGLSRDLEEVIAYCHRAFRMPSLHAAGFSMGGNILLKWLGEQGENAKEKMASAIAVNPPIRLDRCAEALGKRKNWLYEWYFIRQLMKKIHRLRKRHPEAFPFPYVKKPKTIWELDDTHTAPSWGFDSAQDYYDQSSSFHVLKDIAVPTEIISSKDDPFVPVSGFRKAELSGTTRLTLLSQGGHMGYVGSEKYHQDRYWMDYHILQSLNNKVVHKKEPCLSEN